MFLSKDNKIKWKLLGAASVIVLAILMLGIFWFDEPLYLMLRPLDCKLFRFFDWVLDTKIWLALTGAFVFVMYIKKSLKQGLKYRNDKHKISSSAFLADGVHKVKNSYIFFMFCSVLTASVVTSIMKVVLGRARPIFFEALDMTGFYPFSFDWAFNSMPSGHTSASFAALVMLGLLAPKYKCLTWSLAILIGISRVAVGAHWPTDVVLGAFIGMVAADFVKAFFKSRYADQML